MGVVATLLPHKLMKSSRWLYRLVLAMDANFRLKNRLRARSRVDPGLGTGWAYFVADEEYRVHVLAHATEEEVSRYVSISGETILYSCSMDAIDQQLLRV